MSPGLQIAPGPPPYSRTLREPSMSDHEPAGTAITEFSQANARHNGALKHLDDFGKVISRITAARRPTQKWKISMDPGSAPRGWHPVWRRQPDHAVHVADVEQITTALKERDESAMARDSARERLKQLGLNPDDWKYPIYYWNRQWPTRTRCQHSAPIWSVTSTCLGRATSCWSCPGTRRTEKKSSRS